MASNPSPPSGYQLDVKPPTGYVLDNRPVQVALPNQVLQDVLNENPGLAKNFNQNTVVIFANPERSEYGAKNSGHLEFWPSSESGTSEFPHPKPGTNVLEIYSDYLKKDPVALKQAVYGDLLHGMSEDPYWKQLRDSFMKSFTPQELKRQQEGKTWWDDVNEAKDQFGPTYDAYIRGWIGNEGNGHQGQTESGGTMYSPDQIQILQKMQDYLKTGVDPNSPDVKSAFPMSQ